MVALIMINVMRDKFDKKYMCEDAVANSSSYLKDGYIDQDNKIFVTPYDYKVHSKDVNCSDDDESCFVKSNN